MSINSILQTGVSGLSVAQTQLRVTSDNIANINTPGYARKVANQQSLVVAGVGAGATIAGITRVADRYLQAASLSATSGSSSSAVTADFLNQAQSLFGDPSSGSSFFASLDNVYSALSTASDSPASSLSRSGAVGAVNDFLTNASRIADSITGLQSEADNRVGADVDQVNQILQKLNQTNADVARSTLGGGDASGSQDIQAQLLDKLAGLMSVQVSPRAAGGVNVRSSDGVLLVGDGGASTVSYTKVGGDGVLTATPAHGVAQTLMAGGGEIDGLLQMTRTKLPQLSDQLSEFVTQAVGQLNAAHNAGTAVPAPSTLAGRNTGLDLPTAVNGFTGKTTVAIVDSAGVVQKTVDINFGAATMSVNGGPAAGFTSATFLAGLNTALGASGSASFSGGALSLTAASGGVVVSDDPTTPSSKVGQGFSQYFGLNDLVSSSTITNYDTGLQAGDQHGFTPGGVISLQLTDSSGNVLRTANVTVPAAGSMASLIGALNAGTGLLGQFSLDANGRMSFAAANGQDVQVAVASDNTQRGAGGPSISQLFGIGSAIRGTRTDSFSVRTDIAQNNANLAFATFDRTAAAGKPALAAGDGTGALAMAQSGSAVASFGAAGALQAINTSVLSYAAELSGQIGASASAAADAKSSADAVSAEANSRRSSVEGVNLDEELVNLTTYQQAYNASTRVIQAAKDIYDLLLNMVK